ncbi:DUF2953 domain-containing protein [Methanolacinia paynteri]|uniref:DUF2953 domain-containing protein n=1 Tax=Methanolacinia paynteri TaxID=230356 RepID=UPI0009FC4FB2|nr:DUF2953 domain-containing protein [Methanolacinia paynteri]
MVSFLLAAALIIGLILVVLAVHILALPVKFSGRLRSSRSDLFLAWISWGFLRASVKVSAGGTATLYLFSFRLKEFSLGKEETTPEETEKDKQPFDPGKIKPLLDEAAVIFREISFDYLRVNARVGLGDPAGTGMAFGLVSALKGVLSCSDRFELNILPVFETEALECEIEAGFRISRFYRIIAPAIRIFRISGEKKEKNKADTAGGVPAA